MSNVGGVFAYIGYVLAPESCATGDDTIFETLDGLIGDGKIKTYQVALGPAIGWTEEGIEAMERKNVSAVQTVYNILEQTPGNELIERGAEKDVGILVRVPDASGILTG